LAREKRALIALATLVLLLVLASAAWAGDESGSVDPGLPTSEDAIAAINADESQPLMSTETNPVAAEGAQLEDLDREEALYLLESVFEAQLQAPAGIFDELDVKHFISANVAVVDEPEQPLAEEESESGDPAKEELGQLSNSRLLFSTLPLVADGAPGEGEAVDLTLQADEEGLVPDSPLVDVEIPHELEEGIGLPGPDVRISLATDAGDREPSTIADSVAAYPNVARDTDFAVAPTPTGVETLTQLRSPESPRTQVFHLSLPPDAVLSASPDGGAAVLKGDETVVGIAPPTAIDAEGKAVPVSFSVDGDSLLLTASPDEAAEYPILVDPLFQTYEWEKSQPTQSGICNSSHEPTTWNPCNRREEWGYEHEEKAPVNVAIYNQFWGTAPLYVPQGTPGIYIRTSGDMTAGDRGATIYTVPRFFKDLDDFEEAPKSYIASMTLSKLLWQAYSSGPSPYLFAGLWDSTKPGWTSYYSHQGGVEHGLNNMAWPYKFGNDTDPGPGVEPNKNVKVGAVQIQATETRSQSNTSVYVGAAAVELGDQEVPQSPVPGGVTPWSHQTLVPIGFTAQDKGLGVFAIEASTQYPGANGKPSGSWKASRNCKGVAGAACPRLWKSSEAGHQELKYDPSALPTGISYLRLVVEDPVGNRSAPSFVEAKVDHAPPGLALAGTLTEQAKVGINLPEYGLAYSSSDGDETTAAAGSPIGSAGTGTGQLERPMGVATDSSGNVFVVDRLNNRVVKFDHAGNFLTQWGSTGSGDGQFNDPRGITISPNGTVWVVDQGNDRIQAFTSEGAFIRKAKFVDPASQPYAVASGPGGVLWVTDVGLHRLLKLNESGTFLTTATGRQADPASSATDLDAPSGVATDALGNVWVTDAATHRILEFSPAGKWLFQFGAPGTGNSQFNQPVGIDVAPSGNIAVVDRGNGRVQVFRPDGTYLRQFGTSGTGNAQLFEAVGIAFGPGNSVVIADAGNRRIARWTHADHDPQSGAAKVEIEVDGTTVKTVSPGCSTKNCAITGSWTLKADDYSVGQHKVEVIATDAVGISTTKTLDVETHGDLQAPSVTLSGSMTEQATLGITRPAYTLKVAAIDPGSSEERKSGVASATIKVDGKVVDSSAPGCLSGGCAITREWTLNADSYAVGSHSVQVVATDAAGRSTTKALTINVARDTTPPELNNLAPFYTAPKGWVEQESYIYRANASDVNGYGVTSILLRIDGQVVNSASQSCPAGGCSKLLVGYGTTLDMSKYAGGAHPAELIATDGAGNWKKREWTINVDPSGHISKEELTSTLEAVEATSSANAIGEPQVEEEIEGSAPGTGVVKDEAVFESTGTAVPLSIEAEAADGFTMTVAEAGVFMAECSGLDLETEDAPIQPETCSPPDVEVGSGTDSLPVAITPVNVAASAGDHASVDGNATVAQNTSAETDTVLRPLYEGALNFQHIRGMASPDEYSWRVDLHDGMYLHAPDNQAVEVRYPGGQVAFTVATEPAHDAVGTSVPTELSISAGGIITLHVRHKAQSFVYPVVAGAGWQGGFITEQIDGPLDEQEQREEEERIAREAQEALEAENEWTDERTSNVLYERTQVKIRASALSAPLFSASSSGTNPPRKYVFSLCHYKPVFVPEVDSTGEPLPPPSKPVRREGTTNSLAMVGSCLNKDARDDLLAATALGGYFHYINGAKVWVNDGEYRDCLKWGKYQPAQVNCGVQPKWSKTGITVRGDYRYPSSAELHPNGPVCLTLYGHLNAAPPHKVVQNEMYSKVMFNEPCPWPSWPGGG
jgi:streptogramin lyase